MASETALDRLRRRVNEIHVHQGEPSTRVIAVGLRRAISHTTVSNVIKCAKFPAWNHLELVVEYLGGDIEEFRGLWLAARKDARGTGEDDAHGRDVKLPDQTVPLTFALSSGPAFVHTTALGDLIDDFTKKLIDRQTSAGDGIQTGFTDLDRLLSPGLGPGQLVLVTGCPAVGKTTLLLNLVRHAAIRQGVVSTILTLELNEHDIMQRIISAEARVAAHVLASEQLLDDDWAKLTHRTGEIRSAPLTVCQVRGASLADLTSTITNTVEQDHTKLVAIDSIRQIRFDDIDHDSLPATCRALKRLAVQLGVTILAVVPSPDRLPLHEGESPDLTNFGELAGHVAHISEDADIVILIHREDQYDLESPRAGEADLIVAKHRNGPCDIIVTAAQLHLCRFVDMAIG